MNKVFIITIGIILIMGCQNDRDQNKKIDTQGMRISADEKLKEKTVMDYLQKNDLLYLNDTAKWYFYNLYCDDTIPNAITKSSNKVYLSYLPLRPAAYGYSYDSTTLDIYYRFFYNDSTPVQDINTKYHTIVEGISFDIKTYKLAGFIRGHGGHFMDKSAGSRFINLIQPDVVKFVATKKDSINEWYRDALIKHNIKF